MIYVRNYSYFHLVTIDTWRVNSLQYSSWILGILRLLLTDSDEVAVHAMIPIALEQAWQSGSSGQLKRQQNGFVEARWRFFRQLAAGNRRLTQAAVARIDSGSWPRSCARSGLGYLPFEAAGAAAHGHSLAVVGVGDRRRLGVFNRSRSTERQRDGGSDRIVSRRQAGSHRGGGATIVVVRPCPTASDRPSGSVRRSAETDRALPG